MSTKLQETVFCHNCKGSIKLIDEDGSSDVAMRDIQKAINDFEKLFKK